MNINLTDGQSHPVSIYAVDWNSKGISERVDVMNSTTGAVLDSRLLTGFSGGEYLTWNLSGNVTLRFTGLTGPHPVVSGIFFDHVASAPALVASGMTTQGGSKSMNVASGIDVPSNTSSLLASVQVSTAGTIPHAVPSSTSDPGALLKAGTGAAALVAANDSRPNGSLMVNMNPDAGKPRTVRVSGINWNQKRKVRAGLRW